MSKMGLGLHTYLQTQSDVTDLAGDRGFPQVTGPDETLPFYIYRQISYDPTYHLLGCDFAQTRVQVDCYDDDPAGAENLREAVRKACSNYSGAMGSETVYGCTVDSMFDDYGIPQEGQPYKWFVRSVDFLISHLESTL